jgi:hypothetical protein
MKAQRSEKNQTHPHFSDIDVKLASRVPVLTSHQVAGNHLVVISQRSDQFVETGRRARV